MSGFQIIALVLTITALFSYFNFRVLKLPTSIGVMLVALGVSLLFVVADRLHLGPSFRNEAGMFVSQIGFDRTLLQGMLSFMLFAGALQINLDDLAEQKWVVLILASVGVFVSTAVVGLLLYAVFIAVGYAPSLAHCFLFGALISPTDPIAVLAILKTAGVPKSVETRIAGESLFNDGVGVVVFSAVAGLALGGERISAEKIAHLFAVEALGGAALGWALGWGTYRLLRTVDNYQVEVLLTLALVAGGYALGLALHVSGPLAIVVAGLFIGNHGRRCAMSERTREHLDTFWELVDDILNAVLFVLIGFEALVLHFTSGLILAGLLAIAVVLFARWFSVALPAIALRRTSGFQRGEITLLTWGGLRGGISVALALSIPASPHREAIVGITYIVVISSIAVQGLTIGRVVKRFFGAGAA